MTAADSPWETLPQLIDDSCERHADIEALVDGDVRLTYRELRGEIDAMAAALLAAGVEKGDRIAFWAPNSWEWAVGALATFQTGAVVVPINTRFKGSEAEYVLSRAGASLLFTVTDFLGADYVTMLDRSRLPDLRDVVVMRGPAAPDTISLADLRARGGDIEPPQVRERAASVTGADLCEILFTSGTTGAPKGAMLAHGAVCRAYEAWVSVVGLERGDRYLILNPYFHSFGLNAGIIACLMRGATNLPHPVLDVPEVMRRVVDERISMLPGPPAVYQTILNHPDLDSFDMSSLRLAVTGAAVVPVDLVRKMRDRLGFRTIVTGYGLTEASGIATMCRHDDDPETIANTSGRAIPGIEVQVVDDAGTEVVRGEPGEIVVRGYVVMKGYLDMPAETAETIDGDGWLHTGDIGVMDDRGYVRITDRKKDMFIVGGFNAYPAEIENQLLAHPEIAQAAVIGIPDDRLGEVGMAFVVPAVGTSPTAESIIAWARAQMANYKVPRRVEIVHELPLNATGKVVKGDLRDRAARS